MDWLGQLARLAGSLDGPLVSASKRAAKQRAAGERPTAVADHADVLLDEALRRLGTVDPWWSRLIIEGEAKLIRPEEFHKPYVRTWLSRPAVGQLLIAQARARVAGAAGSPADLYSLVTSHMEESLDDRQHAESTVIVAIAFLRTSLQSAAKDAGTAAIVQSASGEQQRRFDAVDERLDVFVRAASGTEPSTGARYTESAPVTLAIPMRRWDPQASPPAALLRAEFGAVPFTGRADELATRARLGAAEHPRSGGARHRTWRPRQDPPGDRGCAAGR